MRRVLIALAACGALTGSLVGAVGTASADPVTTPGDYPTTNGQGNAPVASDFISAVGADADAELVNYIAQVYNAGAAPTDARILSFDAINPVTGAAGELIRTKPGCTITRPNGANAGLTAILNTGLVSKTNVSNPQAGDGTSNCIDFARSSRSKKTDGTESGLTFYSLTRDAVTWATIGGSYAPASLTTKQLRDIYECAATNWAQVGGQYGDIHVYAPPSSAATYTFFLQSIGSSTAAVASGCGTTVNNTAATTVRGTQQNDGTKVFGDPQGIAPYAVTKWAAQTNGAPGINDLRGGAVLGQVPLSNGTLVSPVVPYAGTPYLVLNPEFASGTATETSSQGRVLFNVVRNNSPVGALFAADGFVCSNKDTLLPPFGAIPLGTSGTEYCGRPS